jgi:hypothetical protein
MINRYTHPDPIDNSEEGGYAIAPKFNHSFKMFPNSEVVSDLLYI